MKSHITTLYIMTVGLLLTVVFYLISFIDFELNHIFAVAITLILWYIFLKQKALLKYFILSAMALATFNVINFLPLEVFFESESQIGGQSGLSLHLLFNPVAFILLLINLYPYRQLLFDSISQLTNNSEHQIKSKDNEQKQIELWKSRFSKLTNEQLQAKVQNSDNMVKEAVIATKELLDERNKN